jgi:hypothetical protein
MSLIDLFSINASLGRERRAATNMLAFDSKDLAIFCLGMALLFMSLAVVSLAAHR